MNILPWKLAWFGNWIIWISTEFFTVHGFLCFSIRDSLEFYSVHWFLWISLDFYEFRRGSVPSIDFCEFLLNSPRFILLDFYGILWNSMEFYRFHWFLWISFDFSGFPCNFLKIKFHWFLLSSIKCSEFLLNSHLDFSGLELYSFHEFQRNSFEFFAFLWNSIVSIDFYGFLLNHLDFYGILYLPRISMLFDWILRGSLKFYSFHCILRICFRFFGFLWNPLEFNSMEFYRFHWFLCFFLVSLDFHSIFLNTVPMISFEFY